MNVFSECVCGECRWALVPEPECGFWAHALLYPDDEIRRKNYEMNQISQHRYPEKETTVKSNVISAALPFAAKGFIKLSENLL